MELIRMLRADFDAVIVTDVARTKPTLDAAIEACGIDRVLSPALLGLRPREGAV